MFEIVSESSTISIMPSMSPTEMHLQQGVTNIR